MVLGTAIQFRCYLNYSMKQSGYFHDSYKALFFKRDLGTNWNPRNSLQWFQICELKWCLFFFFQKLNYLKSSLSPFRAEGAQINPVITGMVLRQASSTGITDPHPVCRLQPMGYCVTKSMPILIDASGLFPVKGTATNQKIVQV